MCSPTSLCGADDMAVLNAAIKLDTVKDLGQYKAVYIPGGHGASLQTPLLTLSVTYRPFHAATNTLLSIEWMQA